MILSDFEDVDISEIASWRRQSMFKIKQSFQISVFFNSEKNFLIKNI